MLLSPKFPDRILPYRTFWRFFIAILALSSIAYALALGFSLVIGQHVLLEIQQESAAATIRSAGALIRQQADELDRFYNELKRQEEDRLAASLHTAVQVLETYWQESRTGRFTTSEAKHAAANRLSALLKSDGVSLFVMDKDFSPVVPFTETGPLNFPGRSTSNASPYIRTLLNDARKNAPVPAFSIINLPALNPEKRETSLTAAVHFDKWGWDIGVAVPISRMQFLIASKEAAQREKLHRRIEELSTGKSGSLFVFNEEGQLLAHSNRQTLLATRKELAAKWSALYPEFKKAAHRPWGQNLVRYRLPQHLPSGEAHAKIAWTVPIERTGLFVGSTVAEKEIDSALYRFLRGLIIPAALTIILLGGGIFILLRNLLRPVEQLSANYRRITAGDFTARADENEPGEIGDLCRQFNSMVRSLQELMQTEQLRQIELDEMNQSLERLVQVRTKALAQKAAELQKANIRLKEIDKLKSAFLSSVSHELRTPLTSVLGFAKLISKDFRKHFLAEAPNDPKIRKKADRIVRNLNIIIQEGERLTRLINDVLDLAKIESGKMVWRDELENVADLVETAADAMRSRAVLSDGVRFIVEESPNPPDILVDRDRLAQVLINLLDNSFKFTRSGEIRIRAFGDENSVTIEISDTGTGIPEEDLERIFDKFHQTSRKDTLRDKPPGTGLGLPICKQIIEHYKGSISMQSSLGKGTVATIVLPVPKTGATGN